MVEDRVSIAVLKKLNMLVKIDLCCGFKYTGNMIYPIALQP